MTQGSVGRGRRLDTNAVATRYRVCSKTVRRWIGRGLLGAYVTNESSPNAQRYECDEEQLAAFEARHWRRIGPGEPTPEDPTNAAA